MCEELANLPNPHEYFCLLWFSVTIYYDYTLYCELYAHFTRYAKATQ